ncbi:MAG: PspC domain-containing protein [Muribaculaceae bacterium]|nr:PspC domain-containing protein [Muribaculaceae bacterium]
MKRNITVNIFGSLYPMDEDAYAMLNAYITNMRDYFSRQTDGKEIADDIEGRIAELMSELRQKGTEAISIVHVEDIINRIGKPEQFIEEDAEIIEPMVTPIPNEVPKKKLFRDPDHKFLGGVFGGFGCYLGINALWLRLSYIIIIFGLFVNMPKTLPLILLLVCTYFICWASIPLASNPAERLQMRGERVNISTMCNEFLTSTRELFSNNERIDKDGRLATGLIAVIKWISYTLGVLILISCVGAFVAIFLGIIGGLSYPWTSSRDIFGEDFPIIIIFDSNPSWLIWTAILSFLTFILLTLYLTVHFAFKILGRVKPMSTTLRILCMILWLISITVCTASSTKITGNAVGYHNYVMRKAAKEEFSDNAMKRQKEQLTDAGWVILKERNIRNYTNKGEYYTGDKGIVYFDAGRENDGLDMEYEIERTQKVAPGKYRLEAKGRTNGNGAEIFAFDGQGRRYSRPIPVCGNKGGSIWKNAGITLSADTAKLLPNRHYLSHLSKVNNSQGYGWSDIVIEDIIVGPDSIIRYGITNVTPDQTWDGSWLSASSFELKRQE